MQSARYQGCCFIILTGKMGRHYNAQKQHICIKAIEAYHQMRDKELPFLVLFSTHELTKDSTGNNLSYNFLICGTIHLKWTLEFKVSKTVTYRSLELQ